MTTYKLSDYWPKLNNGQTLTYDNIQASDPTATPNGSTMAQTRNDTPSRTNSLELREEAPVGHWNDTWYVQPMPSGTVEEYADAFPGGRYTEFYRGFGIMWGVGLSAIGDRQFNKVETSLALSRKTWPFFGVCADNVTTLEAHFDTFTTPDGKVWNDVVVVHNIQTFYNFLRLSIFGTKSYERRSWLALGIGFIQTEYLPQGSVYYSGNIRKTP